MSGGHTDGFVAELSPVNGRQVGWVFEGVFGAAGERSGYHVGRFVHVDPGPVEGDLVVEGFQHLGPIVDGLRVCEVWPNCVYQIPNLNDKIRHIYLFWFQSFIYT